MRKSGTEERGTSYRQQVREGRRKRREREKRGERKDKSGEERRGASRGIIAQERGRDTQSEIERAGGGRERESAHWAGG